MFFPVGFLKTLLLSKLATFLATMTRLFLEGYARMNFPCYWTAEEFLSIIKELGCTVV